MHSCQCRQFQLNMPIVIEKTEYQYIGSLESQMDPYLVLTVNLMLKTYDSCNPKDSIKALRTFTAVDHADKNTCVVKYLENN